MGAPDCGITCMPKSIRFVMLLKTFWFWELNE
jgi:hypothetical protein